ncbi:MAG: hypothetical protein IIC78_12720 [Chloroflexi bacterium]|nr:hypothetical protein [Chloroflexota bacterium]
MSKRKIKAATKMIFGAPAAPMPEAKTKAIARAVAAVHGITEAHLPQCFIEDDREARQVLVIGVQQRGDIPRIVEELMGGLKFVFSWGEYIDIFPFESAAVPGGVREAGCLIFREQKKPWWKKL